eukprot:11541298-Alexandrium_andersonii.AAC.1
MSASLVGSEMCIRDRCSPTLRAQLQRPFLWTWAPCARGGPGGPGGQAVSYTHLTLPTICSV